MAQPALGDVLRFLYKACAVQGTCDLTDRELLERFLSHRDESAFTFLVRRHGPMILGVSWRAASRLEPLLWRKKPSREYSESRKSWS
jgi:hypothetical protein